jgi:hypothetical protein
MCSRIMRGTITRHHTGVAAACASEGLRRSVGNLRAAEEGVEDREQDRNILSKRVSLAQACAGALTWAAPVASRPG